MHPSELAPPKVRAPSDHIVHDEKYGDLDGVGIIYGNVGSTEFHFRVIGDIEKMEYIQVKHLHDGWVLGQVVDIAKEDRPDHRKGQEDLRGHGRRYRRDGRCHGERGRLPWTTADCSRCRALRSRPATWCSGQGRADQGFHRTKGAHQDRCLPGVPVRARIRIEVDINAMVQKHVSILAKTGGGKSFLCGDLIEELMKHDVTVMVIDPHGDTRRCATAVPRRRVRGISTSFPRVSGTRYRSSRPTLLSTRTPSRSSSRWPTSTRGNCWA